MANIDILIPLYNAESYLGKTIESVLSQTHINWELLILDDCSTDKSFEIAAAYAEKDTRIRVLRNEHNLGMHQNWNKGISLCKQPYFIKLDADDVWHPSILEKSIKYMEKYPEVGLIFSRYVNIDETDNLITGSDLELPEFASDKPFSCVPLVKQGPAKFLSYPILRQGLSIMRKAALQHIGSYSNLRAADTEYYFRMGCHYQILCIDEVLYYYRQHDLSDSKNIENAGLRDHILYETKLSIVNYYYEHGKLTKGEFKDFAKQLDFQRRVLLFVNYLNKKRHKKAIVALFNNFLSYPKMAFSFYLKRAYQKIENAR